MVKRALWEMRRHNVGVKLDPVKPNTRVPIPEAVRHEREISNAGR